MSSPEAVEASPPGPVLRLRLSDPRQLFNSMDPAPFRERDLDGTAAAYIVDWAREAPARLPLALEVVLDGLTLSADEARVVHSAVGDYFKRRAAAKRRQVRQLFRVGRISLVIGIGFVALAAAAAETVAGLIPSARYAKLVQESLIIGGWVALWRPMEIFLYDWWPMMNDARLYDRLGRIDVSVHNAAASPQGAL